MVSLGLLSTSSDYTTKHGPADAKGEQTNTVGFGWNGHFYSHLICAYYYQTNKRDPMACDLNTNTEENEVDSSYL
jgi:hypothetical protein